MNRRTFILSALAAPMVSRVRAAERPWQGDLGQYKVNDPMAGYFDLAARRELMQTTADPILAKARQKVSGTPACPDVLAIPVQNQKIVLPSFYEENAAWRKAVTPFRDFEDAVSNLAFANVFARDRRFADCLIDLLKQWASLNGLAKFNYQKRSKQGWYQVESTLFAIAHAIAAIRPDMAHREAEIQEINKWLLRVSKSHFSFPGEPGGTCCNNHYYRRCVHATIVGVITGDHQSFQNGIRAIYSALSHATTEGALPLEMERGPLAAHYQNYAVMYLAMIAEIATRQGYPLWELEIEGRTLHTLIKVNNNILADPNYVIQWSGTDEISLKYRKDRQYFAWFEFYLSRFDNPEMEAFIADRRPLYNRSLGGHLTALFYVPPENRPERPKVDG